MFRPRNAVATSFWGVPRTTQDADCLVAVPAIAYQRLADALNSTGFVMDRSPGPQPVTVEALLQPFYCPPVCGRPDARKRRIGNGAHESTPARTK
jgi:hypothetical protein